VQIVLSGQPEFEEKLYNANLRQLRSVISLWCRTNPLNGEETQAYMEERLRIAGGEPAVFIPRSGGLVYRYSKGIPRHH